MSGIGRGIPYGSQGVASPPSRASFPPHFLKIVGEALVSGPLVVRKLRFGVIKGMLPVKTM